MKNEDRARIITKCVLARSKQSKQKKKDSLKRILCKYSEPGSNRYGHYCPQDFKSGVSTYSTIRAT